MSIDNGEFYAKLYNIIEKDYLIKSTATSRNYESSQIYHYCPLKAFQSIIKNGTLRFSDIQFLNDTTEFNNAMEIYDSFLKHISSQVDHEFYKIISDDKLNSILHSPLQDYKVLRFDRAESGTIYRHYEEKKCRVYTCSFSVNGDALPLWTDYGEKSSGCNLEFMPEGLIYDYYAGIGKYQGRVIYDDIQKEEIIKRFILDIYELWKETDSSRWNILEHAILFSLNTMRILFKNNYFNSEEEYRVALLVPEELISSHSEIVLETGAPNLKALFTKGFFKKGEMDIPYIDVSFNRENLFNVTLGPYAKDQVTKQKTRETLSANEFQNVYVSISGIPFRDYNT